MRLSEIYVIYFDQNNLNKSGCQKFLFDQKNQTEHQNSNTNERNPVRYVIAVSLVRTLAVL